MHEILTWSTIFYWIAIVMISFIGAYLLFIFFACIGIGLELYNGLNAKVKEDGLEIFSRKKGKIAFYTWNQIKEIKTIFNPPMDYLTIYLNDGSTVELRSASFNEMKKKLEIYNIDLDIKGIIKEVKHEH
jgi:hypothetical protein